MNRIAAFLTLVALAARPSSPAAVRADPSCPAPPIHLAFYEYGKLYENGVGIDADIVTELERRTGCPFRKEVMARARIWSDLESGALDMSVSGIQTPQRDRFAWFVPYMIIKNHAILGPRAARSVHSPEEFLAQPKLVFGVVRSFRHGEAQDRFLEELRSRGRIEESPDAETLFQKLKSGRIDGLFSQSPVYSRYLKELDMQAVATVQDWTPGEAGVPHGLILAKSRFSQGDAARWRSLVGAMRTDGTLLAIFRRHLDEAEARRILER